METCFENSVFLLAVGDDLVAVGKDDNLGNPCNYGGNVVQWTRGRQMSSFGTHTYEYDAEGNRTRKVVNGTTTYTYNTQGGRLNSEVRDGGIYYTHHIFYSYDARGICGIEYCGTEYYLQKNLQGDVVRIVDGDGSLVARYVYDAWGNHKVLNADGTENTSETFIGNINPIRYRGYYYDTETGLYYLQTRYYDPTIGRFINADDISCIDPSQLNGCNLYAYCGNNPVMYIDPNGQAFFVFLIAALIGFAVSFGVSAGTQAAFNGGKVNWGTALIDGLFGAVSGALWMVPGLGPVATGLINAGLTAVNGILTTGIENDWQFTAMDFVAIGISAFVSGAVSGVTRSQFISAGGRQVLNKTHKFVGTVSKRMVTGYYNNGVDIFSESFKSAFGQMWNQVMGLNFGKGFWKDWLITLLQSISSASFSRGLNGLQW